MIITKSKLTQIIKEELAHVMGEAPMDPTMVGGEDMSLRQLAAIFGVEGVGADLTRPQDGDPTIPYLMYVLGKLKETAVSEIKKANRGPMQDGGRLTRAVELYIKTVADVQANLAAVPKTYAKFLAANNLANWSGWEHMNKVLGEMKEMGENALAMAPKATSPWNDIAAWLMRNEEHHGKGEVGMRMPRGQSELMLVNPQKFMKASHFSQRVVQLGNRISDIAKSAGEEAEQPAAEV
jgi:uncharacterized phage-associated protein